MMTNHQKKRRITEKRLETKLATLLERWAEVRTFRDAGVLTQNRGLVLALPNGQQFQLTIVESTRFQLPPRIAETNTPHTIQIVNDLLVVLDEDGNGCDGHEFRSLRTAKRQLRRWQDEYTFDYADAMSAVSEFFASIE